MKKVVDKLETKFVREYFDINKKLTSRWTFDTSKFTNGPIMVEHFVVNTKESKKI